MKKNFMKIALAIAVVATGSYGSYKAYNMYATTNIEDSLLIENLEALAQSAEQPELDCRYAKNLICISLHPTNPKLDKEKKNATWN
ncbi:MAG: hypothetical protein LUD00_02325 [Prevotellaceae bacterium]|nr:hypothetical protein [Prevotellaceae bacterium]